MAIPFVLSADFGEAIPREVMEGTAWKVFWLHLEDGDRCTNGVYFKDSGKNR